MLTTTLPSYVKSCGKLLKRLKCSPCQRLRDRSSTMIEKLMPFHWNQVTWPWLKLTPTGGRGKWRTGGRRNHMKWSTRLLKASLPTSWETSGQDAHESSTKTGFFSSLLQRGLLSVWSYELSRPGAETTLEEQTLKGSEAEEVPQSANCPLPAQHQTGENPLGWVNRKLYMFFWMFSRASFLDQGWKVQCRGFRGVWKSTSVLWQWRYWSHQWGSKDMTSHNNFNPTSLQARDCKLITLGGVKWGH